MKTLHDLSVMAIFVGCLVFRTLCMDFTTTHVKLHLGRMTTNRTTDGRHRADQWTLPILHIDSLIHSDNLSAYHKKLARDAARVTAITKAVSAALTARTQVEFETDVVSGLQLGTVEYLTRIGVGTPPTEQYMVLDTGSDVIWMQCQPCRKCYPSIDPIFDPSTSASFTVAACRSPACEAVGGGRCADDKCTYTVSYGDGSETGGTVATETLTFGNTVVQNVALGCGHNNAGLFTGAAGLLGLGRGAVSFPSQLGAQTDRVFTVCLIDRDSTDTSTLIFGRGGVPAGSVFTNMIRNPAMPSFYYVSLAGIAVAGKVVPVPAVADSGDGGVIVDTGTAVTRLRRDAYVAVRDAYVAAAAGLRRAAGRDIFETCFDLAGLATVEVPSVGLYFGGSVGLMLPARNYLVAVDSAGTFCLGFAAVSVGPSIVGNILLQHVRVSFDSGNLVVGFAINEC